MRGSLIFKDVDLIIITCHAANEKFPLCLSIRKKMLRKRFSEEIILMTSFRGVEENKPTKNHEYGLDERWRSSRNFGGVKSGRV